MKQALLNILMIFWIVTAFPGIPIAANFGGTSLPLSGGREIGSGAYYSEVNVKTGQVVKIWYAHGAISGFVVMPQGGTLPQGVYGLTAQHTLEGPLLATPPSNYANAFTMFIPDVSGALNNLYFGGPPGTWVEIGNGSIWSGVQWRGTNYETTPNVADAALFNFSDVGAAAFCGGSLTAGPGTIFAPHCEDIVQANVSTKPFAGISYKGENVLISTPIEGSQQTAQVLAVRANVHFQTGQEQGIEGTSTFAQFITHFKGGTILLVGGFTGSQGDSGAPVYTEPDSTGCVSLVGIDMAGNDLAQDDREIKHRSIVESMQENIIPALLKADAYSGSALPTVAGSCSGSGGTATAKGAIDPMNGSLFTSSQVDSIAAQQVTANSFLDATTAGSGVTEDWDTVIYTANPLITFVGVTNNVPSPPDPYAQITVSVYAMYECDPNFQKCPDTATVYNQIMAAQSPSGENVQQAMAGAGLTLTVDWDTDSQATVQSQSYTPGDDVTYVQQEKLSELEPRLKISISQEQQRDLAAYHRDRSNLLAKFEGKAVVFAKGKLQGVYNNPQSASNDALKRFKRGDFLVRLVTEAPNAIELRAPGTQNQTGPKNICVGILHHLKRADKPQPDGQSGSTSPGCAVVQ